MVKEKGNKQWGFLAAEHEAGEPLRRTAERAVKAANASEKHVYFVGNVPCAYWPKEESLREARYKEVLQLTLQRACYARVLAAMLTFDCNAGSYP